MKPNIESNIRKKLQDREVTSSSDLWKRLDDQLDKSLLDTPKTRKNKWIYSLSAAMVLALLGIGFLMKMRTTPDKTLILQEQNDLVRQVNEIKERELIMPAKENENSIVPTQKQATQIAKLSYEKPKEELKTLEQTNIVLEDSKSIVKEDFSEQVTSVEDKKEIKVNSRKLLMSAQYERIQEEQISKIDKIESKYKEIKAIVQNINK